MTLAAIAVGALCMLAGIWMGARLHVYSMRWLGRVDGALRLDSEVPPEQYGWYRHHTHKTDPREASHSR